MQTVLSQLNSVPGVVGSLVCDAGGQLVAHVFPPVFDAAALHDVSRTLADGAMALDLSGETAELLDFRFKDGRLLAKPFNGSMLVVVCTKATNAQFLTMSITAAVAKLDKLQPAPAPATAASATVSAAAAPITPAARAPAGAKKVAAPSSGLDELRRRLAEAAATRAPAGLEGEPRAKQNEARTPTKPGVQWWEGMS
jgi:predicted regulator of Ras-like GTPase activity (Roadblock/LC7/MglB family)